MGDRLGIQVAVGTFAPKSPHPVRNFRSIRKRPFLNILTSGLHETLPLKVLQAFQVPNVCPKREPKKLFFSQVPTTHRSLILPMLPQQSPAPGGALLYEKLVTLQTIILRTYIGFHCCFLRCATISLQAIRSANFVFFRPLVFSRRHPAFFEADSGRHPGNRVRKIRQPQILSF